jgi:hypothetical protein
MKKLSTVLSAILMLQLYGAILGVPAALADVSCSVDCEGGNVNCSCNGANCDTDCSEDSCGAFCSGCSDTDVC